MILVRVSRIGAFATLLRVLHVLTLLDNQRWVTDWMQQLLDLDREEFKVLRQFRNRSLVWFG